MRPNQTEFLRLSQRRGRSLFGPGPGIASAPALWLAALLSVCLLGPAFARPHMRPVVDYSGRSQIGRASFYSPRAEGRRTASGARYSSRRMTAASRTLPLGATARVTNTENGRSAEVAITDRGPFAKGRIMDLSPAAALKLGLSARGVAHVRIEPLRLPKGGR